MTNYNEVRKVHEEANVPPSLIMVHSLGLTYVQANLLQAGNSGVGLIEGTCWKLKSHTGLAAATPLAAWRVGQVKI